MRMQAWIVVLLLGGALCCAGADSFAACSNKVVSETLSPNGRLKAVVFVRDCEGNRNAHLSVVPALAALPDERGNTFIGEWGLAHADGNEALRVQVAWMSDTELSILHGVIRRVKHQRSIGGVKVFYGHLVDSPFLGGR